MLSIDPEIKDRVEETYFIDTHEHLIEESTRLAGPKGDGPFPCDDWAYLLMQYSWSDFVSAGMNPEEYEQFLSPDTDVEKKWHILSPYWDSCRNTGYQKAVLHSIRRIYDEEDISAESVGRITEKMRSRAKKGFYQEIIREVSRVESCQVNSQERVFMESEYPTLLFQDLSTVAMSTHLDTRRLAEESNLPAGSLEEWKRIIDWYFDTYAPSAVAVKNQSAYERRLNYYDVPESVAVPLFERHARGEVLQPEEDKALGDHLFRYTLGRATDFNLPVKLHTGYYAGANRMPLERLRQNAGDLCPILKDFPDTRFVLMHIGYPYQDEFIALAKHYTNAYVDLCWSWIINPVASVRFLKELLLCAPASKVFTFGGDYSCVELVYGHSRIARQGITGALSELVEEGWMDRDEALNVIEPIMRGNAYEVFNIESKTKHLESLLVT